MKTGQDPRLPFPDQVAEVSQGDQVAVLARLILFF
jgi:hypothetical protein